MSLQRPTSEQIIYKPEGTGAVATTVEAKLRQKLNLNDFEGADPTGATNSYAAIVAAIAATPTGGTLELDGFYRCNPGIVINKTMTISGKDRRVSNIPDGNLAKSFLFFDTAVSVAINVVGCTLCLDGVTVAGLGSTSGTGDGVRASGVNNSIMLTGGSVIQAFAVGMRLTQGYYNKIDNAVITFCNTALVADNCYNLAINALTINSPGTGTQGMVLINASQMTVTGGALKAATR